jgi:SAM-dependent methyltransferase
MKNVKPDHKWNERYKAGYLPWDTGEPDGHLVELIKSGTISPGRILEVGCGTGTNSLWLASQGFSVLGVDIAREAVDRANHKKNGIPLSCDFAVMDFLHDGSLSQSFDLVFDRGCFHIFDKKPERDLFARQVSRVLKTSGTWLSLIGSTEGGPRDTGPPRRTATDIIQAIEPYLEITELRSVFFQSNHPYSARAWLCMARHRKEPAQPSTKR